MVAKSQNAGCVFHGGKLRYDLKAKSISGDALWIWRLIFGPYLITSMKKYLLTVLCLLTFRLQAAPAELTEPIGQRLGMCLLLVLDSVHKEGIYHYIGSSGKPITAEALVQVDFMDNTGTRLLTYGFTGDKCDLAVMMLPLTDLDSLVRYYDQRFTSTGKQTWRTPHGRIKIIVAIGAESLLTDHKAHLRVFFT
jgi:hypothetical protein